MRFLFGPPVVEVVDVWETMLELRIAHPPIGMHGRPQRWDITVYAGPRMVQSMQVVATALVEHVRIDHGLQGATDASIDVRGLSDEGQGQCAHVNQILLPPPALRQVSVRHDALHLHWYLPDWRGGFPGLVSKYELAVSPEEHADRGGTVQEFLCHYEPDVDVLQGTAVIRIADSTLAQHTENFVLYCRVRCFSAKGLVWGRWSQRLRAVCLAPLAVRVCNVTSQSFSVVWGRSAPSGAPSTHLPEADVAVERLEAVAWPARQRNAEERAALAPRAVSTGHARVYGDNVTVLDELVPNTVYNVRVRWRQCCGGGWDSRYYRLSTVPEPVITAIPTIGRTFCDVQWCCRERDSGTRAALERFIDEGFEGGDDPSPTYEIITDQAADGDVAESLHRLLVWRDGDFVQHVDVPHVPGERTQAHRITGLPPGEGVRVYVQTALLLRLRDVEQWSWGLRSAPKIIHTVSDIRVVPQERGPNFLVVSIRCDPDQPVRRLTADGFFTEIDDIPPTTFVGPQMGVYMMEALCEGEHPNAVFDDDGDVQWGARRGSRAMNPLALATPQTVQLTQLFAAHTYRFSINVKGSDGEWWGRRSFALTTIAEDIFYVRAYVSPGPERALQIDQAHHDRMHAANTTSDIRYPVCLGEARERELSQASSMLRSRLLSMALRVAVAGLGSEDVVLEWCAFSVQDEADGATSVLTESAQQMARRYNDAVLARSEYRMKVFARPLPSTLLAEERGTTEVAPDLYFRSVVKSAKLVGLRDGYQYTIHMSYFNVVSQRWSPWSTPIVVKPADRLVVSAVRLTHAVIGFRWRKLPTPPIDATDAVLPATATHYDVLVRRGVDGPDTVVPRVAIAEHDITDVACGILQVRVRPWFGADTAGPLSAAACVAVAPLKLSTSATTQSTVVLSWQLPSYEFQRNQKGRIVLHVTMNAAAASTTTTVDLPVSAESYLLSRLLPDTSYVVSALHLAEVGVDVAGHTFAAVDPTHFRTLGPLQPVLVEMGEDFAIVRWPRRIMGGADDAGAGAPAAAAGCVRVSSASPVRLAAHSPSKLRALMAERYEVLVEDVQFGHTETLTVPAAVGGRVIAHTVQHRIGKLMSGALYRVRVRNDCETAFFSDGLTFRTPGPITAVFTRCPEDARTGLVRFTRSVLAPSAAPGAHEEYIVRRPVEYTITEEPLAPPRNVTGRMAALSIAATPQRLLRRSGTMECQDTTLRIAPLPATGTLAIAFRQGAAARGEWLPWTTTRIQLADYPSMTASDIAIVA